MIYFIRGKLTRNIKIGKTNCFEKRFNGISSSDVLVCLRVILDSDDESKYHNQFRHLWSHGEWFKPGQDLIDFIKSLPKNEYTGLKQDVLSPWERFVANTGRRWVHPRTKDGKKDRTKRTYLVGTPKAPKDKDSIKSRKKVLWHEISKVEYHGVLEKVDGRLFCPVCKIDWTLCPHRLKALKSA